MSQRKKCPHCLRPLKSCYCDEIINQKNENNILILRHYKEKEHPFNTARMAELSLSQCQTMDSDHENFDEEIRSFIKNKKPFLLLKKEGSQELSSHLDQLPSHNFIALDGTWSKAKKVLFKNNDLQALPCFHLDSEETSLYRPIRKACSQEFLSTFEAIVKTLNTVENKNYDKCLNVLKYLVEQQLKYMKENGLD